MQICPLHAPTSTFAWCPPRAPGSGLGGDGPPPPAQAGLFPHLPRSPLWQPHPRLPHPVRASGVRGTTPRCASAGDLRYPGSPYLVCRILEDSGTLRRPSSGVRDGWPPFQGFHSSCNPGRARILRILTALGGVPNFPHPPWSALRPRAAPTASLVPGTGVRTGQMSSAGTRALHAASAAAHPHPTSF